MITICDHLKNLKYAKALPNAFTEHGAIMVASVLNTERAVQISMQDLGSKLNYTLYNVDESKKKQKATWGQVLQYYKRI